MESINDLYYCFDNDGTQLLRFYSDSVVLGVPISGQIIKVHDVLRWFNKENYKQIWSKGIYKNNNGQIDFTLKCDSSVVSYSGRINQDKSITLFSYSLTTGHKSKRTFYVCRYNEVLKNHLLHQAKIKTVEPIKYVKQQNDNIANSQSIKTSLPSRSSNKFYNFLFIAVLFTGCFTCTTRQRIGCECRDGTDSYATGSGACSYHGGVMHWKYKYWWDK